MRHRLLLVVLVCFVSATTFFVVADVRPAHACSCVSFTDSEALEHADVVFTGSVAEAEPPRDGDLADGDARVESAAARAYVFDVDEVHKGDAAPRQTVRSEQLSMSCGLELTGRGPFLVFAKTTVVGTSPIDLGTGELYAGLCGGTRPLLDAPLDVAFAGAPRPPNPDLVVEPPSTDDSSSLVTTIAIGATIAGVVLAIGVFATTRRRRRTTS